MHPCMYFFDSYRGPSRISVLHRPAVDYDNKYVTEGVVRKLISGLLDRFAGRLDPHWASAVTTWINRETPRKVQQVFLATLGFVVYDVVTAPARSIVG